MAFTGVRCFQRGRSPLDENDVPDVDYGFAKRGHRVEEDGSGFAGNTRVDQHRPLQSFGQKDTDSHGTDIEVREVNVQAGCRKAAP